MGADEIIRSMDDTEDEEIIVLTDDKGYDSEFIFLGSVSFKNKEYCVMIPSDDSDDDIADVVILLKEEKRGTISYYALADEKLLKAVFEEFKRDFKDTYMFA